MYRPDNGGTVASQPTPKAAGPQGWFIDGDPEADVEGTTIPADFLNQLVANIQAVLTAAGITPSKTVNNQLLQATNSLYGGAGANNANNGSRTLPGGTIIKWGTGTTNASGTAVITFTTAFPNAIYNVQITHAVGSANASAFGATYTAGATASFTVWASTALAGSFYWFAVGS